MLALLGPLGGLLGLEAKAITDKLKRQVILWGALGALGMIAIIFLLVAANNALATQVGPVIAPLIMAGVALFIAIVAFLVVHFRHSVEVRDAAERKRSAETTALATTAAIAALPLLLPVLKRYGLPAGGLAAATYALLQSKAFRNRD